MQRIIFGFLIALIGCQMHAMELARLQKRINERKQQPQKRQAIRPPIINRVSGSNYFGQPYIEYGRREHGSSQAKYVTYYPKSGLYQVTGELVPESDVMEPQVLEPLSQEAARAFYQKVENEYDEQEIKKGNEEAVLELEKLRLE